MMDDVWTKHAVQTHQLRQLRNFCPLDVFAPRRPIMRAKRLSGNEKGRHCCTPHVVENEIMYLFPFLIPRTVAAALQCSGRVIHPATFAASSEPNALTSHQARVPATLPPSSSSSI